MEKYHSDDDIIGKTTRILKSTIREAPIHFRNSKLVNVVLERVISMFNTSPQSCFLYLCSIYIDEYGGKANKQTEDLFDKCFETLNHKKCQLYLLIQSKYLNILNW
eukprot:UN25568